MVTVQNFSKSSIPLMRADAQFAVVEAVIKGYHKWIEAHGKAPQEDVWSLIWLWSIN